MKNIILLFVFVVIFICAFGCNSSDKFSEIKIGMTYEEVEEILGKPNSILRGANELRLDINKFPYEITKGIDWDTTDILNNKKRWILPNEITTIGGLIYVTWVYEKTSRDTFFVVLNKFKEIRDTVKSSIPKYFIANKQVSQYEYDRTNNDPKPSGNKTKASKVDKRIEYTHSESVERKEIKTGMEKTYYQVNYKFCIIFDSSSGRVTESGYFPFSIKELNSETINNKIG